MMIRSLVFLTTILAADAKPVESATAAPPTARCVSDPSVADCNLCQTVTDYMANSKGNEIKFKNHGKDDYPLYVTLSAKGGKCTQFTPSSKKAPICDTGFKVPGSSNNEPFLPVRVPNGFCGNFHVAEATNDENQGTLIEFTYDATGKTNVDISMIPPGCPGTCYGRIGSKTCDPNCNACPATTTENCIPVATHLPSQCYGTNACPTSVYACEKGKKSGAYTDVICSERGLYDCCKERGSKQDGFDVGVILTPSPNPKKDHCDVMECIDQDCTWSYKTPHNDNQKLFTCDKDTTWMVDLYPPGSMPAPPPPPLPYGNHNCETVKGKDWVATANCINQWMCTKANTPVTCKNIDPKIGPDQCSCCQDDKCAGTACFTGSSKPDGVCYQSPLW